MTKKRMRLSGIELSEENIQGIGGTDLTREGEIATDSSDSELKVRLDAATRTVVTEDQTQVLTNKTIDADLNTISDLEVDNLKSGVLNVSTTLSGASDAQIPSALAVKTYVDNGLALQNQAIEISVTPAGTIIATNVQAAIEELDGDIQGHINDTVDAHDATAISSIPSGNLAATDVQGALNELQTDVDTRATATALTDHINDTANPHVVTKTQVGLGNVDNTSDATKNAAAVALTNKTIDADLNTITNIENADIKVGAAIARSKLASGSNNALVANNGSGVLSDVSGISVSAFGLSVSPSKNFSLELADDATTTGADASVTAFAGSALTFSNGSLTSIANIPAGSNGQELIIVNRTNSPISIKDESGAIGTASARIFTGTGVDLTFADNAALFLTYDALASRWQVIGGSGGGGGGTLVGLSDVSIGVPTDNQVLTYDSGSSLWINQDNSLQQVYNNSTTSEIETNSTNGALDLKRGSASDSDDVLRILNNAGVVVAQTNALGQHNTMYSSPENMLKNGSLELPSIADWTCTVGTCTRTTTSGEYSHGNAALKVALSAQAMNVSQTVTTPSGIQKQGFARVIYRVPSTMADAEICSLVDAAEQACAKNANLPGGKLIFDDTFRSIEIPLTFGSTSAGIKFKTTSAYSASAYFDGAILSQGLGLQNLSLDTDWTLQSGGNVVTATTTSPTKVTSPVTDEVYYKRSGDELEVRFAYRQSNATGGATGSGDYLFNIPSSAGCTIDTTKVKANNTIVAQGITMSFTSDSLVGTGTAENNPGAGQVFIGKMHVYDTTKVRMSGVFNTGGSGAYHLTIGSGSNFNFGYNNPVSINGYYKVPCLGWSSSANVYSQASGNYSFTNGGAITVTATTTNPTKGVIVTDTVIHQRNGQNMKAIYKFDQSSGGTDGSGDYLFTLPDSKQFDSNLVSFYTGDATGTGSAAAAQKSYVGTGVLGNGSARGNCVLFAYSATQFRARCDNAFSQQNFYGSAFFGIDGGIGFAWELDAPISGWSNANQIIGNFAELGIKLGTSQASTSGASIDFTIPANVKRINIMFNGVSTNGTSIIQAQLATSGSVVTTSYISGTGTRAGEVTSTTGLTFVTPQAANSFSGNLVLSLVNSSTNLWNAFGTSARDADGFMSVSGGYKTLSTAIDRVRITTVNGTDTFDAGTINVSWEY